MLLIIGGHPRSGNTTLRDVLNVHPDIYVTSEIPYWKIYPTMMRLLDDADSAYKTMKRIKHFKSKKERLVKELWYGLEKFADERDAFERAEVLGNKTPGSEHYFDEYEDVIGYLSPRYIYCFRDPVKVIQSNVKMPWSTGNFDFALDRLRKGYISLLKCHQRIEGRLFIFRVEEFNERGNEICQGLCKFLNVAPDCVELMASRPAMNTIEKYEQKNLAKSVQLTEAQIATLGSDPVVNEMKKFAIQK